MAIFETQEELKAQEDAIVAAKNDPAIHDQVMLIIAEQDRLHNEDIQLRPQVCGRTSLNRRILSALGEAGLLKQ